LASNSLKLSPPGVSELEVSIFGPGYGECIVVHLGAGQWMIVDSCLDTRRRSHPPLDYLRGIGVDVSSQVQLVVASHWHDDHVRGLSEVFAECEQARFCCSAALQFGELLNLLGRLANERPARRAALWEMRQVFDRLQIRGRSYVQWAMENMRLFTREGAVACEVTALSPSGAAFHDALTRFAGIKEEVDRACRPGARPNHTSIALHVQVGGNAALLGADLEEPGDEAVGWSAILRSPNRPMQRATVFKVAHHGSANAHHDGIWDDLLTGEPAALLSPFQRGSVRLPTDGRLEQIATRAVETYITAPARPLKAKLPPKVLDLAKMGGALSVNELHGLCGQIQLRVDANGRRSVGLQPPARLVHVA
jgi:hypothetical protein